MTRASRQLENKRNEMEQRNPAEREEIGTGKGAEMGEMSSKKVFGFFDDPCRIFAYGFPPHDGFGLVASQQFDLHVALKHGVIHVLLGKSRVEVLLNLLAGSEIELIKVRIRSNII